MAFAIFYSWQSDISNKINRNFIEDVLKNAINKVGKNIEIQEALRNEKIELDKDTKNVSGMPPIVDVIFNKISKCGIFVPDLTFVGRTDGGRSIQNPNVLIEYGWALKEVGYERIVPIMNSAFGEPSSKTLPFDMRHLRFPITYSLEENASPEERTKIKAELTSKLVGAIELILKNNLIKESMPESKEYQPIPFTIKPSIFFKPGENILEPGRHHATRGIPDVQHVFLRIIPSIPLTHVDTSKKAVDLARLGNLMPMNKRNIGTYCGRNKYGSYSCDLDEDRILNMSQLFKSGELWGVNACGLDKEILMQHAKVDFGFFPCVYFEEVFTETLTNYLKLASETLKLQLPLQFIAGATDVEGYKMSLVNSYERFSGNVLEKNIIYKGSINDYDEKATDILRPFFNHVWEECGLERPDMEILK